MIIDKETHKKSNPFVGVLLFFISIVLFIVTVPIGLLYGFLHQLFTKFIVGVGDYCMQMAISIDQLGNVSMQHLLNTLWITKKGYKFGNRDETISSVIGKNLQAKTLTGFGKFINSVLDFIDPNHSLNSIDYYVQPIKD